MIPRLTAIAAALLASLVAAGASAATLREADMSGGAFSGSWKSPTAVGRDVDVIEGVGEGNRYDIFALSLPTGAQKLTFDFTAPAKYDWSYSAGGQILTSEKPFQWDWDGKYASGVQVDYYKPAQSVTLDLADSFGGTLYLALAFTHGKDLAYHVSLPGNAAPVPSTPAPAPVPLPAGFLLIGSAAAALAGVRFARRGAKAA
ncbi:hypothetical protein [Amaricoccus sp.]|uniref:hypothetical protein n=1 Tax=Amaricoccus sp. TaxID=1872485 RepID=UPI001B542CC3|nr:hypothetical protein [Amaricoccus sp.]MBP7002380.1 hypothetical protein [Amaricoccus sp.]